uniref:Uncharacterized protein n=1 Tax=Cucumis melo TaxID=3656 RepID=A0A9I9E701_CUCME
MLAKPLALTAKARAVKRPLKPSQESDNVKLNATEKCTTIWEKKEEKKTLLWNTTPPLSQEGSAQPRTFYFYNFICKSSVLFGFT